MSEAKAREQRQAFTIYWDDPHVEAEMQIMPAELRERIAHLRVRHHFDYGILQYGKEKKNEVEGLKVSAIHPMIELHPATRAPMRGRRPASAFTRTVGSPEMPVRRRLPEVMSSS